MEVAAQPPWRAMGQSIDRIVHIWRTADGRRVEAVLEVDRWKANTTGSADWRDFSVATSRVVPRVCRS